MHISIFIPKLNLKTISKMANNNNYYSSMILPVASLLILLLFSAAVEAAPPRPPSPRPTPPRSPSPSPPSINLTKLEFKLSFFWPQGYCKTKSSGCERATNLPKDFTIHGFWPIYKAKCTASTETFQLSSVTDIKVKMENDWPDLKNFGVTTKYVDFWKHEWDAHGRVCTLFTVHNYFDHTLKLFDASHLLTALANRPNTPEAVRNVFSGKEPNMLCGKSADGKTTYLQELQFCLDGSQKYVNCPKNTGRSFCPDGKTFSYGETS